VSLHSTQLLNVLLANGYNKSEHEVATPTLLAALITERNNTFKFHRTFRKKIYPLKKYIHFLCFLVICNVPYDYSYSPLSYIMFPYIKAHSIDWHFLKPRIGGRADHFRIIPHWGVYCYCERFDSLNR